MTLTQTTISRILTRASGYLKPVASHSLQPYRGCALGNSLCGVGCYVQHNFYLTKGEKRGSYVEGRMNAAEAYRDEYEGAKNWVHRRGEGVGIFMSFSMARFQAAQKSLGLKLAGLEAVIDWR